MGLLPSLCCRILRKLFGSKSPGVGPVCLAIKQTIFLREILVENRAIESFKEERYLIRQGDLSRRPSYKGSIGVQTTLTPSLGSILSMPHNDFPQGSVFQKPWRLIATLTGMREGLFWSSLKWCKEGATLDD